MELTQTIYLNGWDFPFFLQSIDVILIIEDNFIWSIIEWIKWGDAIKQYGLYIIIEFVW